jgi:hypothetical protein
VRAASKLKVGRIGRAAVGEGDDVVEFEKAALGASSRRPDERTPSAVAAPDFSLHRRRDLPTARHSRGLPTRPLRRRELLPFEVVDRERQRTLYDRGGIAIRNDVPQQILGAAQLVVGLARDRDL